MFDETCTKPDVPYLHIWSQVEAASLLLTCGFDEWLRRFPPVISGYMANSSQGMDDGNKVIKMIEFIGCMNVFAVDRLIKENVFNPDSPVKNLSQILGLLAKWVATLESGTGEVDAGLPWLVRLVELADMHKVPITPPDPKRREEFIASCRKSSPSHAHWRTMSWSKKVRLPYLLSSRKPTNTLIVQGIYKKI